MKAISLAWNVGSDLLGWFAQEWTVAYSEWEKEMKETHELNFPKSTLLGNGDITQTSNEELQRYNGSIDLLFAGFPCQGFSHAGKKLPHDPRNTLFKEFIRSTQLIHPKYVIGENVKGLLTRKTVDGELYINVNDLNFIN